ncbi:Outer dense fiber protein 3-like protein 2 [Geranomyces variabilis]|nr:Outer dense fiber protein 3-like protein 2 [Geranomyces variabilis]
MTEADNPKLPKVSDGRNVVSPQPGDPKEIPIAARLKGPGPAAYTLPSTLGMNAKTLKRAPAYSFGVKIQYERPDPRETPGPNVFFPQTTRVGRSHGPAFSLQGGYKKGPSRAAEGAGEIAGELDTPGPGKYNPAYVASREPKAPAYSMGGRRSADKKNENPGPAQYNVAATLGLHPAITMSAAAAFSIKPPRPFKLESNSPGPAAYSSLDPAKIKKSSPAYSLGARWHTPADSPFGDGEAFEVQTAAGKTLRTVTPGPGQFLAKHIIAAGERPQGALAADIAANQNADSTPGRSLERRAFKDINTKDPDVKYGTYYAELSEPAYGLWIWSNLARNMRVSLRNGGTHIPFPANTSSDSDSLDITQFYSQPVLMYLIPLFIFLGTLLLTCLTTFLNGCCILCCRKRRLGRRQKDPFTGRQKGCAIFGLAFVSLAWCAAIAGGLSGSDYLGKSITILKVSADKIFQDTSDTFGSVNNVVDNTFKYILTSVNGTADNVTALIPMDSANAVATSINTMADSCDATQSSLKTLQTASTAFQGRKDSLSANSGLVASTITALNLIKNSVDSLNAYQTAPGRTEPYRISYATTDPITTDLESTRTAMQSWQSLSQIINTVVQNMPDLASIASASRNAGSNFTQQVLLLTTEPTAAIKKTAQDQLSPVQNDISDQFASIKASISDKQDQFNQYTPYITQGQTYRLIGGIVLFCLPALILFSVLFGVTARKPGAVKCCLCGSIPYTLLAVLLTILILLFSWITGEVCTIAFDRSVNGTAPMVDLLKMVMGNDTANSYAKAMAARESCLQGDPIMTAINMFVDTSKFDVVSGATSAIMSLSLGDITGSLDLSSILGTNKSPTSATTLADNLVSELSQYSTDDITDMKLAVNNANAALGATLSSLRNPATDPDLQMQSGTASADERGFALTDLQNRIDAIRTSISDLQAATGSLGQARAALDALTDPSTDFADIMTKANSFDSYADHITPNFQDVATKIANFVSDADAKVTAGVPTLQANMISAVTIARDKIMKMDVKCQNLATDTVNLEMGMCDGLLTGGDAFWFAFFILCSGGAMSVPVFISAANMLADRESGRPKGETGSGKTKKAFDTGKPTEKGKGKGKGKDDVEAGQVKWNAPGANSPGGGPGEHFQVSKSAALSPTDVEPKSPERNSQPDSARIYPEVEPHLPGYNAEGGVHRAPSDAKKPFSMSGPSGTGSPHASPRVSQQGAPHSYGNAAPQRQSVQMHAYAPEDDDIQEMRPSWLGGGGGGSAGPSVHDGEISGSFSPRARHPYQPVSPADSYLDSTPDGNSAPQQQYAHPHPPATNNSRRVSAAQHPEYEHVVSEFSKRVSQQPPAHVYDDRGYQVPPPQPYYEQPEQPHYGDDQQYDEYGRPRY